jgi:hypothetical protein
MLTKRHTSAHFADGTEFAPRKKKSKKNHLVLADMTFKVKRREKGKKGGE